jgi:hypothetical protein
MLVKNVAVRYLLFVVGGIPLVIGMLLVVSVFGLSFIIQGSLPVKTHNILKNVSIAVFWKYNQNTSIIEVYRHYSFFPFVKQKVYSKKYRFNKFGYKEVIGLNVLFEKDSNCIVISDDEASIDTIPIMDIIK